MTPALQRQPAFVPSPSAESVLAESAGDAAFATTLAKGLVVLEAFDADAPMLGNMEISARTGIPRPTVARLTHTLAELGYLRYDQDLAKYRLGARALRMVRPLLASMKFRQVARPLMQELAQSVRGTVSIGLLDGTAMIYVESARSGDVGPHTPDIGLPIPVILTAMGRAAAAILPATESALLEERMKADGAEFVVRLFRQVSRRCPAMRGAGILHLLRRIHGFHSRGRRSAVSCAQPEAVLFDQLRHSRLSFAAGAARSRDRAAHRRARRQHPLARQRSRAGDRASSATQKEDSEMMRKPAAQDH